METGKARRKAVSRCLVCFLLLVLRLVPRVVQGEVEEKEGQVRGRGISLVEKKRQERVESHYLELETATVQL